VEVLFGKLLTLVYGVRALSVKEALRRTACEVGWDAQAVRGTAKLRLC
jgi:hypothetical protein